ncbi:MAG: D-alanyl-D-alanine carboxypeptidase [Clostridia bacterium]|nr:D-alanyl-D-alanine carboxypeptidase [Clostridia bacterium]
MKKFTTIALVTLLLIITIFNNYSFAESEVNVYSGNYIMIETTTGKVVCEKDSNEVLYPASTTKIMTAILTLEHCNLTDTATVSHNAIFSVPVGYSHAMLVEGEVLTIDQLLHLLLIPSANDAAVVLAEHIAGSVDSFSTMMNTKALELGCTNTNFVNPNGIHSDDHYTTPRDLAIMARYAMNNEIFRKIVTTTKYTLPATNLYPEADRFFKNTNELIMPDERDAVDNYYYPYANGIKTGFTNPAGECLVASAKKDDKEFIIVILGSGRTENGLSERFLDSKVLFDYAFNNYKTCNLNNENALLKEVEISNANIFNKNMDVLIQDKIDVLIKNNQDLNSITPTIEFTSDLKAPIIKNSVIGKITYNINGNIYTSNLLAGEDMTESTLMSNILTTGSIILVVFLLFKLLKYNKKRKKKSKKKTKDRTDYMYW